MKLAEISEWFALAIRCFSPMASRSPVTYQTMDMRAETNDLVSALFVSVERVAERQVLGKDPGQP